MMMGAAGGDTTPPEPTGADVASNWTDVNVGPTQTIGGDSIAYSPTLNRWIISAGDHTIYSSTDNGSTWVLGFIAGQDDAGFTPNALRTPAMTNAGNNRSPITWDGSKFIVGLGGTLFTSPNGVAWTNIGTPGKRAYGTLASQTGNTRVIITSILYVPSNGSYYITAQNAGTASFTLYRTTNLIDWDTPLQYSSLANSGYGKFVSDGTNVVGIHNGWYWRNSITAGLTGTPSRASISVVTFDIDYMSSINTFVVVASSGNIRSSTDGITWTTRTSNTSNSLTSVANNGTTFVAVGNVGTIRTSTDAITWTTRTSNTTNNILSVVHANGRFIAYTDAKEILSSSDGATWVNGGAAFVSHGTWNIRSNQTSGANGGSRPKKNRVAYSPSLNLYVMAEGFSSSGGTARLFSSSDGRTWTQRASRAGGYGGVIWTGNRFISWAGHTGTTLFYSADGLSWSAGTTVNQPSWGNSTLSFTDMVFAGGFLLGITIAAGRTNTGAAADTLQLQNSVCRIPENGTTIPSSVAASAWRLISDSTQSIRASTNLASTNTNYHSVIDYDVARNKVYLQVSGNQHSVDSVSAIFESDDLGLTWSSTAVGSQVYDAISHNSDVFYIVNGSLFKTSVETDAIVKCNIPEQVYTLASNGSKIIAVAYNSLFSSTDGGTTWSQTTPGKWGRLTGTGVTSSDATTSQLAYKMNQVAITYSEDDSMWAVTNQFGLLLTSADNGDTWSFFPSGNCWKTLSANNILYGLFVNGMDFKDVDIATPATPTVSSILAYTTNGLSWTKLYESGLSEVATSFTIDSTNNKGWVTVKSATGFPSSFKIINLASITTESPSTTTTTVSFTFGLSNFNTYGQIWRGGLSIEKVPGVDRLNIYLPVDNETNWRVLYASITNGVASNSWTNCTFAGLSNYNQLVRDINISNMEAFVNINNTGLYLKGGWYTADGITYTPRLIGRSIVGAAFDQTTNQVYVAAVGQTSNANPIVHFFVGTEGVNQPFVYRGTTINAPTSTSLQNTQFKFVVRNNTLTWLDSNGSVYRMDSGTTIESIATIPNGNSNFRGIYSTSDYIVIVGGSTNFPQISYQPSGTSSWTTIFNIPSGTGALYDVAFQKDGNCWIAVGDPVNGATSYLKTSGSLPTGWTLVFQQSNVDLIDVITAPAFISNNDVENYISTSACDTNGNLYTAPFISSYGNSSHTPWGLTSNPNNMTLVEQNKFLIDPTLFYYDDFSDDGNSINRLWMMAKPFNGGTRLWVTNHYSDDKNNYSMTNGVFIYSFLNDQYGWVTSGNSNSQIGGFIFDIPAASNPIKIMGHASSRTDRDYRLYVQSANFTVYQTQISWNYQSVPNWGNAYVPSATWAAVSAVPGSVFETGRPKASANRPAVALSSGGDGVLWNSTGAQSLAVLNQ